MPVPTNQEFRVHFGSGVDFSRLYVQYSDPVLIENDQYSIILHINHTDRTEAFEVNYK
jgi:hypothetical protein